MSLIKRALFFTAASLMAAASCLAGGIVITYPNHGTVNLKITATSQDQNYNLISTKTNHTSTATNVISTYKSTVTSEVLDAGDLIDLLENSLNMTFPAGRTLQMTRSGDVLSFFVADSTGTNVFLPINTNLFMGLQVGEVPLRTGKETVTLRTDSSGPSISGNDTEAITQIVTLGYNDEGRITDDATHTKFFITCVLTDKSSRDIGPGNRLRDVIKFEGIGFGELHSVNRVFAVNGSATITGTMPPPP